MVVISYLQSMSVCALIAALIALASASAEGANPWQATVAPPRPGLPAVTIDLGYPGPYVPPLSAPLTMRATAGDVPFDGYIGYHFAVSDRKTLDTPVIARATLRPHESWSFTTTVTLRFGARDREIAIEWRNRAMELIAARSAGTPPWTWGEGLRLVVNGIDAPEVLGAKPYVERAEALPDRAQWYAGFSTVVTPLATWLDLPERVRKAIFASGVTIVFFGFPRPDQSLGRLEKTLLPVSFSAQPGSYDAPWPYRGSRQLPAHAPMSWIAKPRTDKIGSDQNPYIVRTKAAVWAPDAVAVTLPLPVMARVGIGRKLKIDELQVEAGDWAWEVRQRLMDMVAKPSFLSTYSSAVATSACVILAVAAWILLRKKPRALVAMAVVLAATVLFAQRGRIRPSSAVRHYVIRAPIAPGIVDHFHVWRAYGPTPLPPGSSAERTSITGDYGRRANAELRTSETPTSMGWLIHFGDWDAVSRWSYQRELDNSPASSNDGADITASVGDFHTPIKFWLVDRPGSSGLSRLEGRIKIQSDGRGSCVFALPSGVRSADIRLAFTASETEIEWATGKIKLSLDPKKNVYSQFEIPPDVLRQIVTGGGIFNLRFARPETAFQRVWIDMRESKS